MASELVHSTIAYGGASYGTDGWYTLPNRGAIFISNGAKPTISGNTITQSLSCGVYCYANTAGPSTYQGPSNLLTENTFSNNLFGDVASACN